jgi:hypothetical protein
MAKLANLAQMTTGTTGPGTVTLGAATTGYRSFTNAGVVSGDVVSYAISDGTSREYGTGVVTVAGPTVTMTRVLGGSSTGVLLSLSGSAIVSLTPRAEDLNSPLTAPATWNVAITSATVNPAVNKTLYEVTGAAAPFPIYLSTTAAVNDAVAVCMRDYTSSIIVTVDAGLGGTISDFGQTHRLGVQHTFMVYRCVGPQAWIVEWDPYEKELRYRAANAQVGVVHGNSLLYMDSTGGARTITVPSNTTDPLPLGFQTELMRFGANDVTLVADVGVIFDTDSPLIFPKVYSRGVLTKVNLNEWTWNLYGFSTPVQRIITASPTTVTNTDDYLFINTTIPGICTVNFPSVASRGGRPLRIKDIAGSAFTYNHVMARNGTDVFEGGFTSFTFFTNFQGQTFVPVTVGGVGTWAVM